MNSDPSFLKLLQNIAFLLSLILIFDLLRLKVSKKFNIAKTIAIGILIGAMGILIMMTPWVISPGIFFDTRSVLLSISGFFFGAFPTLIAMVITIAFRIILGGGGALTGSLVIVATGMLGILWRHVRKVPLEKVRWWELYLFGVVIHLVMLALMLTLPKESIRPVYANITLPVMLIYPLGNLLLGLVLRNRLIRATTDQELLSITARLNRSQQLSKIGGWEYEVATQKIVWTDEVYRIHGYQPDSNEGWSSELIDKSILCYLPEDRQIILDLFQKCVIHGISYDMEFPFRPVNGQKTWIRTKAEPVFQNGKIVRVIGNIIDITENKLAELAIIESESKFRTLVENAPVGIVISDAKENSMFVNKKFTQITGYTVEEIPSVNEWWLLAYPEEAYRETVKKGWQQIVEIAILEKRTNEPFESKIRCKDGTNRYLEISFVSTGEQNIVTFVDITQRKLAENEVREKEAFLRALMDNLPIGVAVNSVSPIVEFEYINDNFLRFYQITRDQLTSPDAFWDVVYEDPEFRKIIKERVLEDIASGDPKKWVWKNIPITRKGKETRYISAYNTPVPDKKVHISTVVDVTESTISTEKIKEDGKKLEKLLAEAERSRQTLLSLIEDQKEAEEHIRKLNRELEQRVKQRTAQLEASNKELEAFAYSVSHDLRAPLRGIDGFTKILEQEYAPTLDEEGNRIINIIRKSTQKLDQLIVDILALSRVSRMNLQFTIIDMTNLVNAIYQEVITPELAEKFTLEVSDLPKVEADPTLMHMVWTNLLNNAIKYTQPKNICKIVIHGKTEEGMCTFSIQDNGVGYDPRYEHKLFNLFQRLHNEREFEGTGVGLAIVKRIVDRHHGKVWSQSIPGEGATFYFSIPQMEVV